jgi:hypothetical protein
LVSFLGAAACKNKTYTGKAKCTSSALEAAMVVSLAAYLLDGSRCWRGLLLGRLHTANRRS